MASILYLETNFLISYATGRDRLGLDRLTLFRPAIPGICFLEAVAWMEGEKKRRKAFGRSLADQVVQLRRDRASRDAATLVSLLDEAFDLNARLLDQINDRLFEAIERVAAVAEVVEVTAAVLDASRRMILIDELTDNLIMHAILDHARAEPASRAFFSENHKDFSTPAAQAGLAPAGVDYFRDTDRLVEWAGAQGP